MLIHICLLSFGQVRFVKPIQSNHLSVYLIPSTTLLASRQHSINQINLKRDHQTQTKLSSKSFKTDRQAVKNRQKATIPKAPSSGISKYKKTGSLKQAIAKSQSLKKQLLPTENFSQEQAKLEAYRHYLIKALQNRLPYPKFAQKRNWEGQVTIGLEIDSLGKITHSKLLKKSHRNIFNEVVLQMLSQLNTLNQPPRAHYFEVPIVFRLINSKFSEP